MPRSRAEPRPSPNGPPPRPTATSLRSGESFALLRGAMLGLLLGVALVVVHDTVEGVQDGFAVDGAAWAPAGSLRAAVCSVAFDLSHPSSVTVAFLGGSVVLGAAVSPLLGGPPRPCGARSDRFAARPSALRLSSPSPPSRSSA